MALWWRILHLRFRASPHVMAAVGRRRCWKHLSIIVVILYIWYHNCYQSPLPAVWQRTFWRFSLDSVANDTVMVETTSAQFALTAVASACFMYRTVFQCCNSAVSQCVQWSSNVYNIQLSYPIMSKPIMNHVPFIREILAWLHLLMHSVSMGQFYRMKRFPLIISLQDCLQPVVATRTFSSVFIWLVRSPVTLHPAPPPPQAEPGRCCLFLGNAGWNWLPNPSFS